MRYHGNKICPDEWTNECGRRTAWKNIMPVPRLSGAEGIKHGQSHNHITLVI